MTTGRSTRSALRFALASSLGGLVLLGGLVAGLALGARPATPVILALATAGCAIPLLALWHLRDRLRDLLAGLERLRANVLIHCTGTPSVAESIDAAIGARVGHQHGDLRRLCEAVDVLVDHYARHTRAGRPEAVDPRISTVLAAVDQPICAITDDGLVSLANAASRDLFGSLTIGTSIFHALLRRDVMEAVSAAQRSGHAVDVAIEDVDGRWHNARVLPLPSDMSGAVLRFDTAPGTIPLTARKLEIDLTLHDNPPPAAVSPDTPLSELPAIVYDSETTGLDVSQSRLVSMGAVRTHGTTVYRSATFDLLVNPGMPIPPRSTEVHGITNEMVADAPPFREVVQRLDALAKGTVMVGHSIGFDVAILVQEAARAGLDWSPPPALDTMQLLAVLYPEEEQLSLEVLCPRFGIPVHGRHTALGDALVTAELWVRLLPLLSDAGVATLADAQSYAGRAKALIARQAEAGWHPAS